MGRLDTAGRQIAGLLTYNPGPGIYSRLERAVEQMPESVRVQELPGLLKRYKDGVPGWELKAVDLDSTIAGRNVVPRDELLAAVRERSPVYTTREIRLEAPQPRHMPEETRQPALEALRRNDYLGFDTLGQAAAAVREYPDWRARWEVSDADAVPLEAYRQWAHQDEYAGRAIGGLGATEAHGPTRFHGYADPGAKDYTELVFLQPGFGRRPGHHWHPAYPKEWGASQAVQNAAGQDAVAHMRMASYGDALRLLESQSDVLNDAIKAGADGSAAPSYHMQQAQVELDIKRLAMEAARSGKRVIEIASPESIASRVGMPLEHAQHRYGKVAASELERLGRKMGGLVDETPEPVRRQLDNPAAEGREELKDIARSVQGDDFIGSRAWRLYNELTQANLSPADRNRVYDFFGGYGISDRPQDQIASDMYEHFVGLGYTPQQAQTITSRALFEAPRAAALQNNYATLRELQSLDDGVIKSGAGQPGRRYRMSDEMFRRLIQQGVGASVLAPLMMQGEE